MIIRWSKRLLTIIFFLYITGIVCLNFKPLTLTTHPVLLKSLILGQNKGYILPGSEFEIFRPYLPRNGRFSVIFDEPFAQNKSIQHRLWNAQNYLCPLILNHDPAEELALVLCSDESSASKRLNATHYTWLKQINPGAGIARKQV
ncbi:MAG: hypothetical protein COV74_03120 [Candidatus Omnitrophica bacterium CG11_big_fil_rev_8_21_14_0_20_45_26]|uniref:Uncharacterized protein n=1 Tax=Candidatus Abzuiibacterium crystallinum TaxID=1974748 RepID=A0A2H0LR46_9BACT|nr:MAG: hypothetical protein COV74_03120 [Candidatus Omnitrophica bacterium CG11_big_fil_rev_8_21_14_0_20_45_26]PIW64666.1 MAG: hypothetical protein COW12_05145 [Candidatus Omnitrophica bacterium CG12_big_fil_rev_8_21_14_0_65_45_16]